MRYPALKDYALRHARPAMPPEARRIETRVGAAQSNDADMTMSSTSREHDDQHDRQHHNPGAGQWYDEKAAFSSPSPCSSLGKKKHPSNACVGLYKLAAQAYGAGDKYLVGVHLQRMVCFISLISMPLAVIWWNAEVFLTLVLPHGEVATLASLYMRIMTLRIPAFTFFECGKRYFHAQGLFHAPAYALAIGAYFNAALTSIFVWNLDWGFVSVPIAIVISENVMVLLLFTYFHLVNGSQCWGGFTKHAFSG